MSLRWPNNVDNGILRKHDMEKEKRDDILVFGYSCKLFRDDEKALYIDQGKHLIPWMGDESVKIDRYDCRGNMGHTELSLAEAKVDGVNWLQLLSSEEQRAEKLCDEERYRALYTNEDEEEMYKEEELKRLHMMARGSSYGQVQFNYEGDPDSEMVSQQAAQEQETDKDDEPFVPPPHFNLPQGMPLPDTMKLNAIIEKTAAFIASQGVQMEILLKAKQAGNPQFDFLSLESPLHHYYSFILQAIRERRYFRQPEEKQQEKVEEEDHYLHPSLAPVSVESAPSIPSIAYKPSADCAYSMLVNQIKGRDPTQEADGMERDDIAPPGTELLVLPKESQEGFNTFSKMNSEQLRSYAAYSFEPNAEIAKGPVMYSREPVNAETLPVYQQQEIVQDSFNTNVNSPKSATSVTTAPFKLIHYSDSESESDTDSMSFSKKPSMKIDLPPTEQQVIIDKMASYVAKNGDTFEQIVKMKGDPRFSFLNSNHRYYAYYKNKREFYEASNKKELECNVDEKSCDGSDSKSKGPVSFSIKKMKEPEPLLPKPALPYESTTDEEGEDNENSRDSTSFKDEIKTQQKDANPATDSLPFYSIHEIAKVENISVNTPVSVSNPIVMLPVPTVVKAPQPPVKPPLPVVKPPPPVSKSPQPVTKPPQPVTKPMPIIQLMPFLQKSSISKLTHNSSPMVIDPKTIYHVQNDVQPMDKINIPSTSEKVSSRKRSHSKEKRHKVERSPRSHYSEDEDRERERRKKKKRRSRSPRRKLSNVVITVDDDDGLDKAAYIDLTGEDRMMRKKDLHNKMDNGDSEDDERKKKAAAFLSKLKGIPTLATQQQSSLASAMVKTLHSYHSSKKDGDRSRRSKKHKRSRSKSYSSDSETNDRRSSERYGRRHHHRSKHYKSKKSYSDDRSSKSRGSSSRKSSPRQETESKPDVKNSSSCKKLKAIEEEKQFKPKKQNDKLLTTSLKELVKETRKDFLNSEPIKMSLDIFSEKSTAKYKKSKNDWEDNSNKSSQNDSESGEISSTSSSSEDD